MTNLVQLPKPEAMPRGFPGILREMADACERGEMTAFVGIAISNGEYSFVTPSSLQDSLFMASLLQHRCAQRVLEVG